MYEPMQPEIVSQTEREHEVHLELCDGCEDEWDVRLLEPMSIARGARYEYLCPDCHARAESHWESIGEDIRDGRI